MLGRWWHWSCLHGLWCYTFRLVSSISLSYLGRLEESHTWLMHKTIASLLPWALSPRVCLIHGASFDTDGFTSRWPAISWKPFWLVRKDFIIVDFLSGWGCISTSLRIVMSISLNSPTWQCFYWERSCFSRLLSISMFATFDVIKAFFVKVRPLSLQRLLNQMHIWILTHLDGTTLQFIIRNL